MLGFVLCATLLVAGCGTKAALNDEIRPQELRTEKRGMALLALEVDGGWCSAGAIHLATEVMPGKFKAVQRFSLLGAKSNLVQMELPEGTYHIGVIACVQGYRVVNVGTHNGSTLIGDPLKSMGSFTVAAGEVINLGEVTLARINSERGGATVLIAPMSQTSLEGLRTKVPKLHASAKVRLMTTKAGEAHNFTAELLPQQSTRTTYIPIYRR